MMEEVFKDEKESENSVATINHLKFPNLKTIKLDGLPMLGALYNAVDAVIECPSIEKLDIDEVSLQKVFGRQLEQVMSFCILYYIILRTWAGKTKCVGLQTCE